MSSNGFIQVRAALGALDNGDVTDANITGAPDLSSGTFGAVETQKIIDRMRIDAFSRDTEFRQVVTRERLHPGTITASWLLQGDAGLDKTIFYSDGGKNTPDPSLRKQVIVIAKALRSDYEVSGLIIAGGFFDVLNAEGRDALTQMNLIEEQAMINGTDASDGVSGSYLGLHQLLLQNAAHGDTASIYNLTRGSDDELDVQAVDGGTSGTTRGTLDLADMDAIMTKCDKRKLGGRRIFLMSFERQDEQSQLLQPQQRFTGGVEHPAGFRVPSYRNVPILRSKRMSFVGVINTGSASNDASTDSVIYYLDMDNIVFNTVGGVDQAHIPIMGNGDTNNAFSRSDVRGGYYKTYGMFRVKRFDSQGIIWNLQVP